MPRLASRGLRLAAVWTLLVLPGCCWPGGQNENSGSLLTASMKVLGGRMTSLTQAEIQILADWVSQFVPAADISLTQAQAAGIQEFLKANSLNTLEDIRQLMEQAQADPTSIVIPEGFEELFANLNEQDLGAEDVVIGQIFD